jgi:hypothetical protein
MADPILNEVNLTTNKVIHPQAVEDNLFLDSPFLAHLRAKALQSFSGGAFGQHVFLYAPLNGGAYQKGDNFNTAKVQTLAGTVFQPRTYQVTIPEFLEDLEIFNRGEAAVFSLIAIDMANAMNTISAIIAVAMHSHGQAAITNQITNSRTKQMNGWVEAMNDGITPGWEGDFFVNYGTQLRNGVVGSTLNSEPRWAGTAAGAPSPVTYGLLEETYQDASIGREEPDLGSGNKAIYASIKEAMQVQQRFAQERDPYFGFSGMRFNSALIMKDDYFPSLRYGQNNAVKGNWLTSSFTSPATVGSNSNLPTSTSITVGEVFNWYNTNKWIFRVVDSPVFGFGFTGFKPAQDNTKVVGQVLAAVNLECTSPRLQKHIYGLS